MSRAEYCLAQDEDSHWYFIPLRMKGRFEALCAKAYASDDYDDFNDAFEEYRVSGPFTLIFSSMREM